MEDEKNTAQQTDSTPEAENQSDTKPSTEAEQKKPAPKKAAAQVATKQPATDEKPHAQSDAGDTDVLREENARLHEQVAQLQVAAAVTRLAQDCGVDPKAVPYVSKLIDLSAAVKDGKCDDEKIKRQIDKLLADLPQLKAHIDADDKKRVTPIGVAKDASKEEQSGTRPVLAAKKWNRFN